MFNEDFHYKRKRIYELCKNHLKRASYSLLRGIAPTQSLKSEIAEKAEKYQSKLIYSERLCSFGDLNPDKTFYVIRIMPAEPPQPGLFAQFLRVAARIRHANRRGLTPIVDMKIYDSIFPKNKPAGVPKNSWECFFEQPSDVPLDEVYGSKRVLLSRGYDWWGGFTYEKTTQADSPRLIKEYNEIINRQMRFNSVTSKFIDDSWNAIKGEDEILAVMSRGTDYRIKKPKHHHIQPEPEVLLEKTIEMMSKYGIKRCFLTTEEKRVNNLFADALGDAFIPIARSYHDAFETVSDKMWMPDYINKIHGVDVAYRANLEYIRNIAIASRCDYLLTGINSGSLSALLLNGGRYKETVLINIGKY